MGKLRSMIALILALMCTVVFISGCASTTLEAQASSENEAVQSGNYEEFTRDV